MIIAGQVGVALVGREREQLLAVLTHPLERFCFLAEADVGAVLETLLGAHVHELLAEDLQSGDVVDVLLRIRRRDLATDLLQRLDDPDGAVPVAEVVRRGEPDRARAEDRHVDDAVVLSHGQEC